MCFYDDSHGRLHNNNIHTTIIPPTTTTGIPCPVPLEQKEHVLVMSFLGTEDGWPSPQLREAQLSPKAWASCYRRVCRLLRDLYQRAGLVHADLSGMYVG